VADFDLTANPFWLLRTSIRARKQDVIDALEAAVSDDVASEAELLRAQQVILAPHSRLNAELSWLPDLAPSRAVVVAGTLAANPSKEIALQLLDGIVGLSRANVAADICRRYPGQVDLVDELTKSYEALSLTDIEEAINASRRIAGFSQVHPEMLRVALSKIESRHAECATVCLAESACPGPNLSRVIGSTAQPGSLHFGFLEATVRAYRACVGKRLQQIDDALQDEISGMKLNPGDLAIAKRIHAGVNLWSEWNGPVELWDQAKGLEEPRSYAICDKLRDLCLWLANEMAQRKALRTVAGGGASHGAS
jgi:phage tail protein X